MIFIGELHKMAENKQFTITKKIAKHGPNSIIVIPKVLQGELRPKMVVEINIKVLGDIENGS